MANWNSHNEKETGQRDEVGNMRTSGDISHVRRVVAGNPNTPITVLFRLSHDASTTVRRAVAGNPRASDDLLAKMATDTCPEVRLAVAENRNTAQATLRELAKDPSDDVRYGLEIGRAHV